MAYVSRGSSNATFDLESFNAQPRPFVHDMAESISKVGLLRPLVIDAEGTLVGGCRRAQALQLLGATEAPSVRIDLPPTDVSQASTLREHFRSRGLRYSYLTGISRATVDRFDKVLGVAADEGARLTTRLRAAEGITQILGGASTNGILHAVELERDGERANNRYPELSALSPEEAARMADYLDTINDPDALELELSTLRITLGGLGEDTSLSMAVYTHMQNLARNVDEQRANEVAAALAAAISGRALPDALRDRCLDVATQLERTAAGIRLAMTLELERR